MQDVFGWIDSFINFERGQNSKTFRLDRTETLARLTGNPERCCPSIHVAGSKGKGSTTTMIASILDAAGLKTGLYVSPHVVDYRERVSMARGPFEDSVYAAAGDELGAAVARAREKGMPGEEDPTFFELMTILFFLCCRRAGCGAAAVETGMGGRLDSTNIVDPLASVLTPIELEHTEFLGSTIAAIAGEKAGIIKKGRPVIVAPQQEEALAVFKSKAREMDAPILYLPEEVAVSDAAVSREGTEATLLFSDKELCPRPLSVRLKLVGEIQARNAALAALAVFKAFPSIHPETVEEGLAQATLPARFERVCDDPPTVCDGAHTSASVRLAADAFGALYGDGGVLLFGCAAGKDAAGMAGILAPRFSRVIVTKPGDFKKSDPTIAYRAFADIRGGVELVEHTGEAIEQALAEARKLEKPVLAIGSFFLAAAVRSICLR